MNLLKQLKVSPIEKPVCIYCDNTFSSLSSLSNHKKRCKIMHSMNSTINALRQSLEKSQDTCIILQNDKETLENAKETLENDKETLENDKETLETAKKLLEKKVLDPPTKTMVDSWINNGWSMTGDNHSSKIVCLFCNRLFKTSSNLSNHAKICGKKSEYELKIIELNKKIVALSKDKEELINDKYVLNKDKDAIVNLAITSSDILISSISAIKYLTTYHKNTPPLEPIEDFTNINDNYANNTKFIMAIISEYQNEKLQAFIGDYLIREFKKDDLQKQAMWNTDVGRLTYIIRELVKDDRAIWTTDKNGIQVTNKIIKPVLIFLKPLLQMFIDDYNKEMLEKDIRIQKQVEIMEYLKYACQIIANIDNKTLEKDIVKYIAPIFYWDKNVSPKQPKLELIKSNNKIIVIDSEDELVSESDDYKIDDTDIIKVAEKTKTSKTSKLKKSDKVFNNPKIKRK